MAFGKPKTPLTPEQQLQRRQNIGVGLAALSESLRGGDPVGRTMQLQQQLQPQAKKLPNSYQEYLLTDPTPTAEEYSAFLNRGSSPGNLLQVIDSAGNFVTNISKKDALAQTEDLAKKGLRLTQLPTGTEAAPTNIETVGKKIEPLENQFIQSEKLIKGLSETADILYKTPEAANTLVAGGANAYKFITSNIQGFQNIMENNKENPIYQQLQKSPISLEGTDYAKQISDVSLASNISESRIKDLAFAFAAARGQSGRGLSDRDFQNALDILSKGVNAEQKIALFEDVSNRIKSDYSVMIDVAKRLNQNNPEVLEQINNLGSLSSFVNPYTAIQTQTPTSNIDLLVNKYLPQG